MALIINSNIASLNAQRQLASSGRELDIASERLASGKRINSAADDAAGLAISNRMTSQIRGLNQAVRNAMDGVSMIQVAEGALDESTNLLQRVRELSIQAANGIYSDSDRATLDAEVQQLVSEVNRIAETTSFNGQKILEGSQKNIDIQVGAEAYQTISFGIPAMDSNSLGLASTSGDLVGAQMSIDGSGGLASELASGALKINGYSLSAVSSGSNLQTLLDDINNNVSGVSATSILTVESPSTGDGYLSGGEAVNISGILLDGTSQSFSITDTQSLEEMVDKINTKAGSLITASLSDEGKLVLTSDKFATMTVQDTTQGTATGINSTQIADPDIAEVVEGLTSNWVAQAENLIETYFGIKGDGVDLTLDLTFTDGVGDVAARVTALVPGGGGLGTNLTLEVDMADFSASGDPSGGSPYLYMDRIIAHEMVHAVMFRNMNMLSTDLPEWFKEGAAELIHGGDERVELDIAGGNLDNQAELSTAFATGKIGGGGITAVGYSAGYVAVKMMHEDIIAAGGTGIDEVMAYLSAGDDISTALANVASDHGGATGWNSLASFETDFDATGYTFMTTSLNFEGGIGTETDTGAIHGSDYGGSALNAEDVINNTAIGPAQDFNLIVPAQYSGGLLTSDAQLVLTSNGGDPVTVILGANGSDADLSLLGLMAVEEQGSVLGQVLDSSGQMAALNANDLIINGVAIEPVEANQGLMAKVDAINKATADTNVVASIVAQQSFRMDTGTSIENYSAAPVGGIVNAGFLGINGVGVAVNGGDVASDIAAAINALTDYHGATAYADDTGRLHVHSENTLNWSDSVGGALFTELGLTNAGVGTGSIKLNNTEVALSDLTDTQTILDEINAQAITTGVIASIDDNGEFQLKGSSAIQVSLGNNRGLQTLHRLGISFGVDGTENLTDTDADDRIGDEVFTIGPRIQLTSINDQDIRVSVTDDGETATGLRDMNAEIEGLAGSSLSSISVATAREAQNAIEVVDNALETINDARSELGAINNRLEFTVNNLATIAEKTAGARSRIVDADYAAETAQLSRAQVLQQASQTMVAQANQRPQSVLQLLN